MTRDISKKQTLRQKKIAIKKLIFSTAFRGLISVFVFIFGILYVVQISSVSTTGYDMSSLQKEILSLERENEGLEFKIAQYRSMNSVQERLQEMNLVVADNVEYTTFTGSLVARR